MPTNTTTRLNLTLNLGYGTMATMECLGALFYNKNTKLKMNELQATVRFEDVIIYFSQSEWKTLAKWQKELYWEVLTDNYEALLITGQPVTKGEVVAWLERCECLDVEGTQESSVRDPADSVSATNDRPSKACRKERTGRGGPLETPSNRSKEAVTQRGDTGGTPERLDFSVRPQGYPTPDEPLSHTERGQSLASPACSQRPAAAPKRYKCGECGKRFRLKGLLRMHQEISARKTSFPCSTCGLCFTSPLRLRAHQRTHLPAGADGPKASPGGDRLPEMLHYCRDCGDRFRGFLDVLRHQKCHEEAVPRPCIQCEATFMHRIDLATHEEGHLEEEVKRHVRCRQKCICKQAFRLHFAALLGRNVRGSQAGSRDPERSHEDAGGREEKSCLCTACGLLFRQENLEVHYRYCSKQCLQKYQQNTSSPGGHREALAKQGAACPASEGNPGGSGLPCPPSQAASAHHACLECGKRFASKGSLRRHKRKHKAGGHGGALPPGGSGASTGGGPATALATEKLHKCLECGKKLVFKWQVSAHLQGHAEGKSFICHRCGEGFGVESRFQKHRRTCAAGRECEKGTQSQPKLLCQCGKSLSKEGFYRHQAFHAGLRYKCTLCGKVLSFQSAAIAHRGRHIRSGQLPIQSAGSKLLPHMIEKIYVAPEPQGGHPEDAGHPDGLPVHQDALAICGKSSHKKWKLRSPQSSLPRPFKCRDCGKDFAYLACLWRHRKGHAGDFPFQCAECGRGFTSRNYLNLHWKIHTRESA